VSGNQIAPRTTVAAVRGVLAKGNARCSIMLVSGTVFDFLIEGVTDDGLIGQRSLVPEAAAVVFFDAVAMIEFRP